MALQTSGIIKLSQIAAEYDDALPHKLTEFYGKPGLPTSGQLKVTNFYGKAAVATEVVVPALISVYDDAKLGRMIDVKMNGYSGTRSKIKMGGIEYWLGMVSGSECLIMSMSMLCIGKSVATAALPPTSGAYVNAQCSVGMTTLVRFNAANSTVGDPVQGRAYQMATAPSLALTNGYVAGTMTVKFN